MGLNGAGPTTKRVSIITNAVERVSARIAAAGAPPCRRRRTSRCSTLLLELEHGRAQAGFDGNRPEPIGSQACSYNYVFGHLERAPRDVCLIFERLFVLISCATRKAPSNRCRESLQLSSEFIIDYLHAGWFPRHRAYPGANGRHHFPHISCQFAGSRFFSFITLEFGGLMTGCNLRCIHKNWGYGNQ
jgi:hypothetical protein